MLFCVSIDFLIQSQHIVCTFPNRTISKDARISAVTKQIQYQSLANKLKHHAAYIDTNINMRVSKSLMPFGQKADEVNHELIGRPRARSSLDTFVIPGRTRFPSSKLTAPEPADLQITQGLLNPDAFKVPKMTPNRADIPRTWFTNEHGPLCDESPQSHRQVSGRSIVIVKTSPKRRAINRSKTLPNLDTGEDVGKPARKDCSEESHAPLSLRRLASRSSEQELNPFDGPFDSTPESLPTSGTWTTVSNRIFTDSSAGSSSRETQGFVDQYNKLALKHGLPRFAEPPVPIDIGKSTAVLIMTRSDRISQGYAYRR